MNETMDDDEESEARVTVTIDKRLYRVRFADETEHSVTIVIERRDISGENYENNRFNRVGIQ